MVEAMVGAIGEVVMEVCLPLIMARIIDEGVEAGNVGAIARYGVAMVVMAVVLGIIMSCATRIFTQVFDTYDDLNASVQENVGVARLSDCY